MFTYKDIVAYRNLAYKKIKTFLFSHSMREVLVFSVFFLIAFFFRWLQLLDDKYLHEIKIPIEIVGLPENATIVSELPAELILQVEDRGMNLLGNSEEYEAPLSLDIKQLSNTEDFATVTFRAAELLKMLNSRFEATTKLVSIKPDSINVSYVLGKGKKVPVKCTGTISAHPQYYLSDVLTYPDSVMVYAIPAVLDTLSAAYTYPVLLQHISENEEREIELRPIPFVKYTPSKVKLEARVDMYSEKTLSIPIVGVNFPSGKLLRTFPNKVDVTFQVGLHAFRNITAEDFFISVSYEQLLGTHDDKIALSIKKAPKGVRHVRISPAIVEYLIEEKATDSE